MINEIYPAHVSMQKHNISAVSYHKDYKLLPNISHRAPCYRIVLQNGSVTRVNSVDAELGRNLRKFGSNNGTYPSMNLASLFRLTCEDEINLVNKLTADDLTAERLEKIKGLCTEENSNWDKNILDKFRLSIVAMPKRILELLGEENVYEEIQILIHETNLVSDPDVFRNALKDALLGMLANKTDIELAVNLLFQIAAKKDGDDKPDKPVKPANVSIALDAEALVELGMPAVSVKFVQTLNERLMSSETTGTEIETDGELDAFGMPFTPLDEKMPSVKLAGGFDATLRSMFSSHRCQFRYGKIEDRSYPISKEMRISLQTALDWLGNLDHKEVTWVNLDRNVILFAYPDSLPKSKFNFTSLLKVPFDQKETFEAAAKRFLSELEKTHDPDHDSYANRIRFFVLRKLDRARTKVVFSKANDAKTLERFSDGWTLGCQNLPNFHFIKPPTIFPADVWLVLNRVWKMDGTLATDNYKPFKSYHGIELLLDPDLSIQQDLQSLISGANNLIPFLGQKLITKKGSLKDEIGKSYWMVGGLLSVIGLLLFRNGIRKDVYMEKFPYLYGQLLKASDEIHALYCRVVRNGDFPQQFAGSGMYLSAIESPIRSLVVLSQRMNPYITWAKTYRFKEIATEGLESWRAAWLCRMFEQIATQLLEVWDESTRLNDAEKAQMFLGFLAAFPKRENDQESPVSEIETDVEN